jgi:hypothetical protein
MLKKQFITVVSLCLCLLSGFSSSATTIAPRMMFKIGMEDPATHYYHVELRCEGYNKAKLNFKLPAWTPGYYWIMDFAKM